MVATTCQDADMPGGQLRKTLTEGNKRWARRGGGFVVKAIRYSIRDMPNIPFKTQMVLGEIPQAKEDREIEIADKRTDVKGRLQNEVSKKEVMSHVRERKCCFYCSSYGRMRGRKGSRDWFRASAGRESIAYKHQWSWKRCSILKRNWPLVCFGTQDKRGSS